ncbi:MAG: phosphohistidine phosphatase SixA, partial [Shewanella sp.]
LTDLGRQHTALMSNWLARTVRDFDLVLVSPYLRAQQTWQEVSLHFPEPRHWMVLDDLVPTADPAQVALALLAYGESYNANNVLIISHMPLLGFLVSELVPGVEPPLFATSGITLIEKDQNHASIRWQHAPHSIG